MVWKSPAPKLGRDAELKVWSPLKDNSEEPSSSEDGSEEPSSDKDTGFCSHCGHTLDADAVYCERCGARQNLGCMGCLRRSCCCCCCCCLLGVVALIAAVTLLILNLNSELKYAIETVGSNLLGVEVSLASINLAFTEGRIDLSDLVVDNPPGYHGHLFEFGRFVFDIDPWSVVQWLVPSANGPLVLEDFSVLQLHVVYEQTLGAESNTHVIAANAKTVVETMNNVTDDSVSNALTTAAPSSTDVWSAAGTALQVLQLKIQAERVEISNISVAACIHPVCDGILLEGQGPFVYELGRILITDVGKNSNGVTLFEFAEIFVRAIFMAVVKSAPDQIRLNLIRALGTTLGKKLDFAAVHFDAGDGLENVGEFTGWAAGEAASLPGKIALEQAKLGLQATAIGAKMNLEAMKLGTKANLAAAKAGLEATNARTRLTNEAVKTQTALTNAQVAAGVEANLAATKAGTKLSTEAVKAQTALTGAQISAATKASMDATRVRAELTNSAVKTQTDANLAAANLGTRITNEQVKAHTKALGMLERLRTAFTPHPLPPPPPPPPPPVLPLPVIAPLPPPPLWR